MVPLDNLTVLTSVPFTDALLVTSRGVRSLDRDVATRIDAGRSRRIGWIVFRYIKERDSNRLSFAIL